MNHSTLVPRAAPRHSSAASCATSRSTAKPAVVVTPRLRPPCFRALWVRRPSGPRARARARPGPTPAWAGKGALRGPPACCRSKRFQRSPFRSAGSSTIVPWRNRCSRPCVRSACSCSSSRRSSFRAAIRERPSAEFSASCSRRTRMSRLRESALRCAGAVFGEDFGALDWQAALSAHKRFRRGQSGLGARCRPGIEPAEDRLRRGAVLAYPRRRRAPPRPSAWGLEARWTPWGVYLGGHPPLDTRWIRAVDTSPRRGSGERSP